MDGTLTDSGPGIMHAVRWSLEQMGIAPGDENTLRAFVGPPLEESYRKYFGLSGDDTERAVFLYRKYYNEMGGLYENAVYPGVREMLETLKAAGKHLVIATSKRENTTNRVLEHFDLRRYFEFVAAADLAEENTKTAVVRYALRACGITDPGRAAMVGDRENDIAAAKAAGIDSVGALYGYGSLEELESAGAAFIAEAPGEIAKLLS